MKSVLLQPDDFGKRVCEIASAAGVSLQASIVIDLPSLISAYVGISDLGFSDIQDRGR